MNAKGVQGFFYERDNVIELVDSLARDVASGYDFHAVELPYVEIMDVHYAVNLFDLLEKCIRIDIIRNELHDNFGDTNQLRDCRI